MITIHSGTMYITENEFNTALALLACAQNNMGILDNIDYVYSNFIIYRNLIIKSTSASLWYYIYIVE